jgi:hypothetical protein
VSRETTSDAAARSLRRPRSPSAAAHSRSSRSVSKKAAQMSAKGGRPLRGPQHAGTRRRSDAGAVWSNLGREPRLMELSTATGAMSR